MKNPAKDNIISDEPTEEEQKIMERMPYLNLLLEDIREINRAIREGRDGVQETKIFLADVPRSWLSDVQYKIIIESQAYDKVISYWNQYLIPGASGRFKDKARHEQCLAGQSFSLCVRPLVLDALHAKGILLLTKTMPECTQFRIDDGDDENE